MSGPLGHLKVLDLSRVLAGPWAGQILADLGADVIKVERPGEGDDTRGWGPPWLKDKDGNDREAAYYLSTNRNKRSVAIDIASVEGQEIVRKLAADSDVVIENFKVGGLKKYGLDYQSLSKDNPGLVYCSITGFGQDGPNAQQAGYDFIIQGLSGLMSITGEADGPPTKVGTAVTDLTTGMYGVIGILAALAHKDRTGEGQHVDMSLLDTQMSWLANQNMNYLVGGKSPMRRGNSHPNIVPYQAFETLDGHIIVAVGNDRQFNRFCDAVDAPELGADPRYVTNALRVKNRDDLAAKIGHILKQRKSSHWLAALGKANIPHGPINTVEQAFAHPQAIHRGMRVDMDHPLGVTVPTVANPIRLSKTPVTYRKAPPMLGADSDEVLENLGYGVDDRAALRKKGVLG